MEDTSKYHSDGLGVAQVVQHLPSKLKALGTQPGTAQNTHGNVREGRQGVTYVIIMLLLNAIIFKNNFYWFFNSKLDDPLMIADDQKIVAFIFWT
jgi:hypothetical protein